MRDRKWSYSVISDFVFKRSSLFKNLVSTLKTKSLSIECYMTDGNIIVRKALNDVMNKLQNAVISEIFRQTKRRSAFPRTRSHLIFAQIDGNS